MVAGPLGGSRQAAALLGVSELMEWVGRAGGADVMEEELAVAAEPVSGSAGQAADPVEQRIEAALAPGRFISDRACFSFVGDVEAVEREIADLVEAAPGRTVTLYEAFLAGCYEKADEVDDSSGSFGMFVASLCCGWVQARQTAGAAADETATRLLEWMDDDPFGFCYRLPRIVGGSRRP